jgi:hypothetical protein
MSSRMRLAVRGGSLWFLQDGQHISVLECHAEQTAPRWLLSSRLLCGSSIGLLVDSLPGGFVCFRKRSLFVVSTSSSASVNLLSSPGLLSSSSLCPIRKQPFEAARRDDDENTYTATLRVMTTMRWWWPRIRSKPSSFLWERAFS